MTQTVLSVPDISCAHCERTITNALTPVEGVRNVSVDIPSRRVKVEYDEGAVTVERMKAILEEEDYPVESVEATGRLQVEQTAVMAKDPVCGMDVDTRAARHTSEHKGETYYFCNPGCKQAFESEPERYLATSAQGVGCSCCG